MSTSGFAVPDTVLSERQRWMLAALPFTRTYYCLSEEQLERSHGILSPVKTTVLLSQVRSIAVTQTRLQKKFGLSTIQVATDDPTVSELVIRNIRNGALFEERLRRCVEQAELAQPHTA